MEKNKEDKYLCFTSPESRSLALFLPQDLNQSCSGASRRKGTWQAAGRKQYLGRSLIPTYQTIYDIPRFIACFCAASSWEARNPSILNAKFLIISFRLLYQMGKAYRRIGTFLPILESAEKFAGINCATLLVNLRNSGLNNH